MNDEDSDFIDLEFSQISKERMAENAFDSLSVLTTLSSNCYTFCGCMRII